MIAPFKSHVIEEDCLGHADELFVFFHICLWSAGLVLHRIKKMVH